MDKPNISNIHLTKQEKQIKIITDNHQILITPDEKTYVDNQLIK